jgi:hypothetical protein
MDGPNTIIRVDPAPGFQALEDDSTLTQNRISLEIGRKKNPNKNPVAERAVGELEIELLKQDPTGGPVSNITLVSATARLNSRIRSRGLSSREMLYQRDQFTNMQIPITDRELIDKQQFLSNQNHVHSEKTKAPNRPYRSEENIVVGDLVYLYADKDKNRARDRYLVTSMDGSWINIRKFVGNQFRSSSYKVKKSECYKVRSQLCQLPAPVCPDDEEEINHDIKPAPVSHIISDISTDPDNESHSLPDPPSIPEEIVPAKSYPAIESANEPISQSSDRDNMSDIVPVDAPDFLSNLTSPQSNNHVEQSPNFNERPQRNRQKPDRLTYF